MKFNEYGSISTKLVQPPRPIVSVNFKSGVIYLSRASVVLMDIKIGDKIKFLQDTENPQDWFLTKTDDEDSFILKSSHLPGEVESLRIMSRGMCKVLLECFSESEIAKFLLAKNPTIINKKSYYGLLKTSIV